MNRPIAAAMRPVTCGQISATLCANGSGAEIAPSSCDDSTTPSDAGRRVERRQRRLGEQRVGRQARQRLGDVGVVQQRHHVVGVGRREIGAISDTSIDQKKANSSQTDSAASAAVAAERNTTENSSASASQTPP